MSGLFISVDGLDGCGKSTQIALLSEWLRSEDFSVQLVRDPGGTALGESLRDILLHRKEIALDTTAEMLLYMASRAQLVAEIIQPSLNAGKIVLSDRYLLANVVYQGSGGGLSTDTIWQVGRTATAGLLPDLTIILDIDAEQALQRIGRQTDRLESRGLDYMRRVRQGFLDERKRLEPNVVVVEAQQPIDQVQAELRSILGAYLGRSR